MGFSLPFVPPNLVRSLAAPANSRACLEFILSIGDNSDSLYAQRISANDFSRLQAENAQTNMRTPFEDAARNRLAALNALPQEIKLSAEMSSFLQFSEQYLKRAQLTGESIDARSQRIAYISMLNHNLREHGYAELVGDQINNFVTDGSPKHLPKRLNGEMPSSLKMYGEGEYDQLRAMVLQQAPAEAAQQARAETAVQQAPAETAVQPAPAEIAVQAAPAETAVQAPPPEAAMPPANAIVDNAPSAIGDVPQAYVAPEATYVMPEPTTYVMPDTTTYMAPATTMYAPPYSYQPGYLPRVAEPRYVERSRGEEVVYARPWPTDSQSSYNTPPRHSEPNYAPASRHAEPPTMPPSRLADSPRALPQHLGPTHQEHPAPSKAEIAEARQARQQLAELQALRQQYDFRGYLPIQKSTAERMMTMMPDEKRRALGNVFEKVSRDGRTITAADIDAYSIKYTGHRFFERSQA